MKKAIFIIFVFIGFSSYSQEDASRLGITLGYKKLEDNNVSIGVSQSLYFSEANVLLFGGSIELKYISNFKDNHIGVIGANVVVLYMSTGLNISNKYIEPNMGFDLKFLRLDIGYAINYTSENHVTFGVRANIPLLFLG